MLPISGPGTHRTQIRTVTTSANWTGTEIFPLTKIIVKPTLLCMEMQEVGNLKPVFRSKELAVALRIARRKAKITFSLDTLRRLILGVEVLLHSLLRLLLDEDEWSA